MKISLNIETNNPEDLARIAAALNGGEIATTTAEPKVLGKKAAPVAPAPVAPAPVAPAPVAPAPVAPAPVAPAPVAPAPPPTEAELGDAANVLVNQQGRNPSTILRWIAENFQKEDGSPGTLLLTRPDQRHRLLQGLKDIAEGSLTIA